MTALNSSATHNRMCRTVGYRLLSLVSLVHGFSVGTFQKVFRAYKILAMPKFSQNVTLKFPYKAIFLPKWFILEALPKGYKAGIPVGVCQQGSRAVVYKCRACDPLGAGAERWSVIGYKSPQWRFSCTCIVSVWSPTLSPLVSCWYRHSFHYIIR